MQIVCISRGTMRGGSELAKKLAEKMDCPCLSREDMLEAATREGIPVGKLEMAMIKPHVFSARLALEREHYLAFSTAYLLDKAMEGNLVYHGRTGHLLLPGIGHLLRIRAVAEEEFRIKEVMQRLSLERSKAQKYLEEVDEDRRRWVHSLYEVSWEDSSHYDLVINLINLDPMTIENAAAALVKFAQLPAYQSTPDSLKAMESLHLAARARVLLARDEKTWDIGFKVRADDGAVTVSYLPRDAKVAEFIPEVLGPLEGVREVFSTMATTNILWIQEDYNRTPETFGEVMEIATKWNAAVELLRFMPDEENGERWAEEAKEAVEEVSVEIPRSREYNGGIEDDMEEEAGKDDGGLKNAMEELAKMGRSGGGRVVKGTPERLIGSFDRAVPFSLVVVGDIFLSKGHSARLRMSRDLLSLISDTIKAPVVSSDELKKRYLFGGTQAISMVMYLIIIAIIYFLVFTHQVNVLNFLTGDQWNEKALAAVAVGLFVPIIAYVYGNLAGLLMKLIKME